MIEVKRSYEAIPSAHESRCAHCASQTQLMYWIDIIGPFLQGTVVFCDACADILRYQLGTRLTNIPDIPK